MKTLTVFLCTVTAFSSAPLLAVADMPLGTSMAGGDPFAGAVARTVKAMIDYTRWPSRKDLLVLCVAGQAQHASQLGGWRTIAGQDVERRDIAPLGSAAAGCDVVYIGTMPIAAQRGLTTAVRGKGVLTIAESDQSNASEAMFALDYLPQSLSFRLNIDAVSRSGLKVDPRVLRISRASY